MEEEKITNKIEPKVKGPGDDITDKIPLTTSITNLGLTKKVSNLLQRAGINDLERLLKLDYKDLRNVRGLGTKGKNEILMCIHSFGYEMSSESSALEYQNLVRKKQGRSFIRRFRTARNSM